MAEPVLEGASLPEGIEVDETAAYFGITESSDVVHQLMSMDRNQSIVAFFAMVSDIVLKPGEFDFEEASNVLNCEGGEIYYLVSGHLGLMSFSDPILHYLGLPNSMGEDSPNGKPAIAESDYESLQKLADPMNLLKILAIAQTTGGSEEVMKYYLTMSKILEDVSGNSSLLVDIAGEFDASLDVIGHTIPISSLANSTIDTSSVPLDMPPKPQSSTSSTKTVATEPTASPKSVEATQTSQTEKVTQPVSVPMPKTESVPLPSLSVKEEPQVTVQEATVEANLTDRKAAKVTDNAFEGAFGMMAQTEVETMEETAEETDVAADSAIIEEPQPEEVPVQTQAPADDVVEEPFVSAAEMFIQADTNEDGSLSVDELAEAAGISQEESKELHESADKDSDGKMSLSEFVASPAVEKVASNLPKPVAPVRRPVNRAEPRPVEENTVPRQAFPPQSEAPRPIPPQNVTPQPVVRPQPVNPSPTPMPQQQPMWNQPVQPTIRSGVNCRACGIGIDPFWRFCPVCGGQNLN